MVLLKVVDESDNWSQSDSFEGSQPNSQPFGQVAPEFSNHQDDEEDIELEMKEMDFSHVRNVYFVVV